MAEIIKPRNGSGFTFQNKQRMEQKVKKKKLQGQQSVLV